MKGTETARELESCVLVLSDICAMVTTSVAGTWSHGRLLAE